MRWLWTLRSWFWSVTAVTSFIAFAIVVVFALRAQSHGNEYLEWRSRDFTVLPPNKPRSMASNDPEVLQWISEYQKWNRRRWSLHIRANPDAIYAFGKQPWFGYPRNSFDIHFYYGAVIPLLMVLPMIKLIAMIRRRIKSVDGRVPCAECGYDLRMSPERCPECGIVITRTQ